MPRVPHPANDLDAENLPLQLPSAVDLGHDDHSLDKLRVAELALRLPQALDALADLRQALCVHAHLSIYRMQQVRGQSANTRSQGYISRAEVRKKFAADRYGRARLAVLSLKRCATDEVLRDLQESDIVPLQSDLDSVAGVAPRPRESRLGEGYRSVSWIWLQSGRDGGQQGESAEGSIWISSLL